MFLFCKELLNCGTRNLCVQPLYWSCIECKTGNQILSLGALSEDQVYPLKLKGISICYSALKSALCGNYICFGIFRLYGDNHFDNVLQAFVRMLLSVSHSDLLQYRKLSQSYYQLLECLTQNHMDFITSLEPHVLIYILTSISGGLPAVDDVTDNEHHHHWRLQEPMVCVKTTA